ncbi:UNVERIFIED_CONTAM: hypothetical protein FKN15_077966 [Acipenser sinensis]
MIIKTGQSPVTYPPPLCQAQHGLNGHLPPQSQSRKRGKHSVHGGGHGGRSGTPQFFMAGSSPPWGSGHSVVTPGEAGSLATPVEAGSPKTPGDGSSSGPSGGDGSSSGPSGGDGSSSGPSGGELGRGAPGHRGGSGSSTSPSYPASSTFTSQVLQTLLRDVKFGETVSYKHLAEMAGNSKAVRAVGGAMRKNPVPLIVPCHRVISNNGNIGNYMGGKGNHLKQWLLTHEKLSHGKKNKASLCSSPSQL